MIIDTACANIKRLLVSIPSIEFFIHIYFHYTKSELPGGEDGSEGVLRGKGGAHLVEALLEEEPRFPALAHERIAAREDDRLRHAHAGAERAGGDVCHREVGDVVMDARGRELGALVKRRDEHLETLLAACALEQDRLARGVIDRAERADGERGGIGEREAGEGVGVFLRFGRERGD